MTWMDEAWMHEPGVPVLGKSTALTQPERRALLAFAQGADNPRAAEAAGVSGESFRQQVLTRLRSKLHAASAPRLVARGYETGALELAYPGEPPQGVVLPDHLLEILLLIPAGYNNKEISAKLDEPEATVRNHVMALAVGFIVARGIGGRTQLASRAFEFGIIPGATAAQKS